MLVSARHGKVKKVAVTPGPDFMTVWGSGVVRGELSGGSVFPSLQNSGYKYLITTPAIEDFTARKIPDSLYNIFGPLATLSIYKLPNKAGLMDENAVTAWIKGDLASPIGPNDYSNELYFELTQRDGANTPQCNLVIDRPNASPTTPPATNLKTHYYKIRLYLDPNIVSNLALTNYIELLWAKSGGWEGKFFGVFRLKIEVVKGNNGLYYIGTVDSNANGVGVGGIPGYPTVQLWQSPQQHTNFLAPSAFAGWNTFEWFYNPPQDKDDLTTGRWWVTVQPDGEQKITICDYAGGRLSDPEGLPINRLGVNLYSNGANPNMMRVGPWEIWDRYPG
ncbi:MAG: hypothetical protein HRU77_06440 [Gammaproteobacteria bacterium]|nr:MAG: hypothetical protein HRU77_06440 [Gammaproteobacteria bacterium]